MKKLINDPTNVVVEALRGMEAAHGDLLKVHYDPHYITRIGTHRVANKVGVLSGGGSGHEPLHGGFVGRGMLDAACPGRDVHQSHARPDARSHQGDQRQARACCTSSRITPAT